MWETTQNAKSETRENSSSAASGSSTTADADGMVGEAIQAGPSVSLRLRNLTGKELSLIYRAPDGSELTRRLPAEQIKVRVRYNRLFDPTPTEWYTDPQGSTAVIPMVDSRPRMGLLPTCETIDGLPPAEGGVRLIVGPEVAFGLARRGTFRRDLLTPGRARRDPVTHKIVGFESLTRINFDEPPELDELPCLTPRGV